MRFECVTGEPLDAPSSYVKATRAEGKRVARETMVNSIRQTIEDAIHAHASPTLGTRFLLAELQAIRGRKVAHETRAIKALLEAAEHCGAIQADGIGAWIVVDEDALYDDGFTRAAIRFACAA